MAKKPTAPPRMTVTKRVDTLTYDLEGSIDDAILRLQTLAKDYPGCRLSYEDTSEPYDSEERYGLVVYFDRPETDAEMVARLDLEAKRSAAREADERRQFEALKAKYGGT